VIATRKSREDKIEPVDKCIEKSLETAFCLSGCHSLVSHEGKIMGDSAEKLFFEEGLWKYDGNNRTGYVNKNSNKKVRIIQSFPFRSD